MKTALVTGANRGIGLEIARQLSQRDFHVILTGRDENKLSEAVQKLKKRNGSAESVLMDVSDAGSVERAARTLTQTETKLDVLINNAAISSGRDRSLTSEEFDVIEEIMNTNSYGPLRVIRNLLPLLKKPSRIINISSGGGLMSEPVGGWWPAYCISKSLLNAITRHLAYELSGKGISINAVCPGWVQTDMGGGSAPRTVERGAETPVWLASDAPQNITGGIFRDRNEIGW